MTPPPGLVITIGNGEDQNDPRRRAILYNQNPRKFVRAGFEMAKSVRGTLWWSMPGGVAVDPFQVGLFPEPEARDEFLLGCAARKAQGADTGIYTGGSLPSGRRLSLNDADTEKFFRELEPYRQAKLAYLGVDWASYSADSRAQHYALYGACQLAPDRLTLVGEAIPYEKSLLGLGPKLLNTTWTNRCPWLATSNFIRDNDPGGRWRGNGLICWYADTKDDRNEYVFENVQDSVAFARALRGRGYEMCLRHPARPEVVAEVLGVASAGAA